MYSNHVIQSSFSRVHIVGLDAINSSAHSPCRICWKVICQGPLHAWLAMKDPCMHGDNL